MQSYRVVVMTVGAILCSSGAQSQELGELFDHAPPEFIKPNLSPRGVSLQVSELAPGVFALVADRPGANNMGLFVGEHSALVVDANITPEMARQALGLIDSLSPVPIRYLAYTNHHGDHVFGSSAFPEDMTILSHADAVEGIRLFDRERQEMMRLVRSDSGMLSATPPRLPDVVFERSVSVDLGGMEVQIHHFGHGNTPGDAVVFEPESGVAFTGNMVIGRGGLPLMWQYGPRTYTATLENFNRSLDVQTIVPGHLGLADASHLENFEEYSRWLRDRAAALGPAATLDEFLAIPAPPRVIPPEGHPLHDIVFGFHKMNLATAYLETTGRCLGDGRCTR